MVASAFQPSKNLPWFLGKRRTHALQSLLEIGISKHYVEAMTKLEFIEREAKRNEEYQLETMDSLTKEANTVFSFLVVAIGASLGAAMSIVREYPWSAWGIGMGMTSIYLSILGIRLTSECLMARDAWPPGNEPKNLIEREDELDELRRSYLIDSVQKGIDNNYDRNIATADALNWIRRGICVTPFSYLISVLVAWVFLQVFHCKS